MRVRIVRLVPAVAALSVAAGMCSSAPGRKPFGEALAELQSRAASGDGKALYDLATLYDRGFDSISVDSARSSALYRASAEAGYAPARNYLGFRYYNGEGGLERNVDSALYWIARAAESGDAKGAANLGWLLAEGKDVVRNYTEAAYWLEKAAAAGLPSGQSQLADLLRQGLGMKPDTLRAAELYTAAVEGGLREAEMPLLAMMLDKWKALPRDSAMAVGRYYYLHRAPVTGVNIFHHLAEGGDAEAQALLGDAYSRAQGVDYSHEKSLEWFLKAAIGGNGPAQFVIGELLDVFPDAMADEPAPTLLREAGIDPADASTAAYWYARARAQGITDAATASDRLLGDAGGK